MLDKNTRWAVIGAAILFAVSSLQSGVISRHDAPRSLSYAGTPLNPR